MADQQFLFVNARPVKDRLLVGALRAAYRDLIARDRHPIAALFLEVPLDEVDVNVHPARPRSASAIRAAVRGLIVGGLRHALDEESQRSQAHEQAPAPVMWTTSESYARDFDQERTGGPPHLREQQRSFTPLSFVPHARAEIAAEPVPSHPLGVARGQVAATYIVAEAEDGLVIVDQHAAHERLVLERMRAARENGEVASQALLIPEVVELDEPDCERLEGAAAELADMGLEIERFGPARCSSVRSPRRSARPTSGGFSPTRRRNRRVGRAAEPARQARPCRRDHRLPRLGPRRTHPLGRRNERAAARDGGDAALGPVQPRPPDLGEARPRRDREAVRAEVSALPRHFCWLGRQSVADCPCPLSTGCGYSLFRRNGRSSLGGLIDAHSFAKAASWLAGVCR